MNLPQCVRGRAALGLHGRIKDLNSSPVGNTAEEFRQVIKDDLEIFRRVIAAAK